jgi:hypothetical protein
MACALFLGRKLTEDAALLTSRRLIEVHSMFPYGALAGYFSEVGTSPTGKPEIGSREGLKSREQAR